MPRLTKKPAVDESPECIGSPPDDSMLSPPIEMQTSPESPSQAPNPLRSSWGTLILILTVVAIAMLCRCWQYNRWPVAYHVTRQYHGAHIARNLWLKFKPKPLDPVELSWLEKQSRSTIEPPLLETLAAGAYLLAGREIPWFARIASATFWLAGAWFLWDMLHRITRSRFAALFAVAFYLLHPYGILVSQTFQPESLMTLGFCAALWCCIRFPIANGWGNTLLGGLCVGVSILIKPGILLFPLCGAAAGILAGVATKRNWPRLFGRTAVFLTLATVPSLLYAYLLLSGHGQKTLVSGLLFQADFYRGWLHSVERTVGFWPILAAIFGTCATRSRSLFWRNFSITP